MDKASDRPAIYSRDHGRSSFLAADLGTDAYLPLETFLIQGMSGNIFTFKEKDETQWVF